MFAWGTEAWFFFLCLDESILTSSDDEGNLVCRCLEGLKNSIMADCTEGRVSVRAYLESCNKRAYHGHFLTVLDENVTHVSQYNGKYGI